MKKILVCLLAACLLAGLLPTAALAAEEQEYSVLTIPVETGEEERAEDRAQLFALVEEENYVYCYQGTTSGSLGGHINVTPSGDKPSYGYFHVLNAAGGEVAVSRQEYISTDSATDQWYGSSVFFEDMSQVAPGEYTIKMTDDGGKEYACTTKLKVVPKGSLLLRSVSVQGRLRPGETGFDLYINMYGFQRESDLTNLTVTMKDSNGNARAKSTGSYMINSNSGDSWSFYMEMKMLSGSAVTANASYTLELAYPGSVELINAAGAATAYASDATPYVATVQVADPATGTVTVGLRNCVAGTTYQVVAANTSISYLSDLEKNTVYGSAEVTATATTATVTIPMKLNGKAVAMAAYPNQISFTLFAAGKDYHVDYLYGWRNPYANGSGANPWVNFWPYYVKTSTKSLPFTIEGNDISFWKGSGDVLTLTDRSGRELGRCTAMTAETTGNGYQTHITGTLNITGTLQNDTYYNIALNGVEFGGFRAVSQLAGQMNVGSGTYLKESESYDFWTNLDQLLLSADMIHSSGSGHFELVNAAGQTVITGPTVTGTASDYYDHKYYPCNITAAEAQSKLQDGAAYQLRFVDANGSRVDLGYNRDLVYRAAKAPFALSNAYINWWSMKPGDQTVAGQLYINNFRHVAWTEVETALKGMTLAAGDGSTTLTVKSVTRAQERDAYQPQITVELSAPITAGTWKVMHQGAQYNTVTLKSAADQQLNIWSVRLGAICTISGQGLPAGGAYTAQVFRDYTAVTQKFALTLRETSGSNQQLEFSRSAIASLGEGNYRVRVYRGGNVLDDVEMYLPAKGHVAVEVYDIERYYQNGDGIGNAMIESGAVGFQVTGDSGYVYLRCSEDRSALTRAEYLLLGDWYDGFTLSAGDGEKTLYVQLKHMDGTESPVLEVKAWRMENTPVLSVPSSVGGMHTEEVFTVTASSDFACLNAYVEFLDGSGNVITSGNSTGKYDLSGQASGARVTYSRSFDLTGYNDRALGKAVKVRVQLCKGTGYSREDVGAPVERDVRFVEPTLDFGSRPNSYTSIVAIYNAQGQMIYVDTQPSIDWEGKYQPPEEACKDMAYAKLFGLNYSRRPERAAIQAEPTSR